MKIKVEDVRVEYYRSVATLKFAKERKGEVALELGELADGYRVHILQEVLQTLDMEIHKHENNLRVLKDHVTMLLDKAGRLNKELVERGRDPRWYVENFGYKVIDLTYDEDGETPVDPMMYYGEDKVFEFMEKVGGFYEAV